MLTVKKVIFTTMGSAASTTRARVIAWLCPKCVLADDAWNLPPNVQPSQRAAARTKVTDE